MLALLSYKENRFLQRRITRLNSLVSAHHRQAQQDTGELIALHQCYIQCYELELGLYTRRLQRRQRVQLLVAVVLTVLAAVLTLASFEQMPVNPLWWLLLLVSGALTFVLTLRYVHQYYQYYQDSQYYRTNTPAY